MKRKFINTAILLFVSSLAFASVNIPKNAKEDNDKIMSEKFWELWNDDVQKKIDADIEKNRKTDIAQNVGKIKAGTKVSVAQLSHDFKFGAHIFNYNQLGDKSLNARYKSLYGTLFNSATVAFYWNKFEMQDGRPRYKSEQWDSQEFWSNCDSPKTQIHWRRPPTDEVVDFCKTRGVRVHGHAIIWGSRPFSVPAWLFDKCVPESERAEFDKIVLKPMEDGVKCVAEKYFPEFKKMSAKDLDARFPKFGENLKQAFEQRVKMLADYYGDKIESWDIVNESVPDSIGDTMNKGGTFMISERYKIMPADYAFDSMMSATKYFPKNVKLNINDSPYRWIEHYAPQIEDIAKRGARVDIVGVQMHIFSPERIARFAAGEAPKTKWDAIDFPKITPSEVYKVFETIETGRPIHMSEITITAPDKSAKGEMIQAIITRNMYRLWFSLKPVMGITWWNVVDDCGAPKEPTTSGLFTRDMNPKPAFYALDNLINNEWKTNLKLLPDTDGNIKCRGFKGKYAISWTDEKGEEHRIVKEFK